MAEQLHGALATSVDTTGYLVELIALFESIPHANLYSVAIGLGTFIVVRLMKKYVPKAPAALIALIMMTVIVAVFGLDQKGVKVLGEMPSGLPALTLPNVSLTDYLRLLPGALAVVGITLCEALLLVRSCGRKHNTKADGQPGLVCLRHDQYCQWIHRFADHRPPVPRALLPWTLQGPAPSFRAWWRPVRWRWSWFSLQMNWHIYPRPHWPEWSPMPY